MPIQEAIQRAILEAVCADIYAALPAHDFEADFYEARNALPAEVHLCSKSLRLYVHLKGTLIVATSVAVKDGYSYYTGWVSLDLADPELCEKITAYARERA